MVIDDRLALDYLLAMEGFVPFKVCPSPQMAS